MATLANDVLFSIDSALQVANNCNVESILAHKNMTYKSCTVQIIDNATGGALELRLPGSTGTGVPVKCGVMYFVRSVGPDNVVVKGHGTTTVATLTTNKFAFFVSDGTSWYVLADN